MKKQLLLLAVGLVVTSPSWGGGHRRQPRLADTLVVQSLENPTAASCMARSYSDFDAASPSFLDDEAFRQLRQQALSRGYRNDQPQAVGLRFPVGRHRVVRLRVATDAAYSHLLVDTLLAVAGREGSYRLANLVPARTYYYQVSHRHRTLATGTLVTTGRLRMIMAPTSWNIRDLGGWTGWGGNRVRYEQIYRGGSPGGQNASGQTYQLDPADRAELYRVGIRAHLDLRALPGRGAWPDDAKRNAFSLGHTPLLGASFLNMATDWALYDATRCASVVADVAWIIAELRQGHPVYFHCRTGADRTGSLGYILLGLLGCDDYAATGGGNQIAVDYELTSLGLDEQGTIALNTQGTQPQAYSNRYANTIATTSYNFFRTLRALEAPTFGLGNFQERCYYYLNRYFIDHDVPSAGRVAISKTDLDWFVNFMLGLTDRHGNLLPGHAQRFSGPAWALDEGLPSLSEAVATAARLQYEGDRTR